MPENRLSIALSELSDADTDWVAPKPATESEIAAFESLIGRRLPEDYRRYLGTVGGGAPNPATYHGPVIELYVQYIYSLFEDEDRISGLIYRWRAASVPETFKGLLLPVAHVNGGDTLFLSLVNGEVFCFFHEEDTFLRIDDSFSSILKNLGGGQSVA